MSCGLARPVRGEMRMSSTPNADTGLSDARVRSLAF
jgi:hypothetical protein